MSGAMAMMGGSTLSMVSQGIGGMMNDQQQENIANYNAQALRQEANQASDAGANNEAGAIRRNTSTLGDQAASFGEANIGTGAGVQAVEKQSATNARMNELNTWYGGELERSSLLNQADFQQWQADEIKRAAKPPVPWGNNPITKGSWAILRGGGGSNFGSGTAAMMDTNSYSGGESSPY